MKGKKGKVKWKKWRRKWSEERRQKIKVKVISFSLMCYWNTLCENMLGS